MTRNRRIGLALFGLVILLLALVFLTYAFMPLGIEAEQAPLAPTLFVVP